MHKRPFSDLAGYFASQILTAEAEADRIYEPVVGIITDNKDPQKLGRVKVTLPVLSSDETTWWAPIVMMGAGKKRGWFFIPEIGDEVLVLFEQGSIDRPIVVGALWGGKDKPPEKNPGGNKRRVIKSRSGSKVIFDDEQLTIEDGGGKGRITFDATAKKMVVEALAGDVSIQSPTGDSQIVAASIEMTASNNVAIHSGGAMQLGSSGKTDVKASSVRLAGSQANTNCGIAQMPPKITVELRDIPDPYEGRGAGQEANDGKPAPAPLGPSPSRGSADGGGGGASPAEKANAADDAAPATEPPPDAFSLWIQPDAVGGGKLVGESVSIIDPETQEVIAQTEVDEDGNVLVSVPDNKPYDVRIDGHAGDVPSDEVDIDALASSSLSVALFTALGLPLPAGIRVTVRGGGGTHTLETEPGGHIELQTDAGVYEIEVEGQTFTAHTLRSVDLQHEGGHAYQYQLDDDDLDEDALADAREQRSSSSDEEED